MRRSLPMSKVQRLAPFKDLRQRIVNLSRLISFLELAAFTAFTLMLFFSSSGDWDYFFSTAEADRRSWVIDHQPPLWSYQFCAGVTRSGDPQSFGLSPLFLPVLAAGPFWGLKLMVLISLLIGYGAFCALFSQLLGRPARIGDRIWIRSCALSFLFGNFFLWHLIVGQITVVLIPLVLAIAAAALAFLRAPPHGSGAWVSGKAQAFRWLSIVALTATCLAGGFNIAVIFFILPLTVAGVGALGLARPRESWRRMGAVALACALGVALAWPKIHSVLDYQARYPRTDATKLVEPAILASTPLLQLAPTLAGRLLGLWNSPEPYTIPEYSAFSVNAWALLVLVIAALAFHRRGYAFRSPTKGLTIFLGMILLVGASLSLGDSSLLSLHALLNRILAGSVRAIGRYQLLFSLSAALGGFSLMQCSRHLRNFAIRRMAFPWALLAVLNLITFTGELTPEATAMIMRFSANRSDLAGMNRIAVVKRRNIRGSYMFPGLSSGLAVTNCYDPIVRGTVLSRELEGRPEVYDPVLRRFREGYVYPIVASEIGNPPDSCRLGTYFTQNEIHMDSSCPEGTCLNVNDVRDEDKAWLRFNREAGKYCLHRRP